MARLRVGDPNGGGSFFELKGDSVTLGRGVSCDLILDDEKISRRHALLRRRGDEWILSDLNSTNGLQLNNERLREEQTLRFGDRLRLGRHELVFEEDPSPSIESVPLSPAAQSVLHGLDDDALDDDSPESIERLRAERRLYSLLYDAGKTLQSCCSTDEIIQAIVRLAFRLPGVERSFVQLLDERGEPTQQTRIHHRKGEAAEGDEKLVFSRSALAALQRDRQPILICDLKQDARFQASQSMLISGLRSAICAPLLSGDKLIGALYADNPRRASAFRQEELDILAIIAAQAAAAMENERTHRLLAEQRLQRVALERFLSPELVERIVSHPEEARLGGVNQQVTILFSDVRGFTSLSEKMPPERILELLNTHFTILTEHVFEHGGAIDKFLGDGMMALFGAPIARMDDAVRAVRCACSIQNGMEAINREASLRGLPAVQLGIGVNTGVVTAGNVGSPKRLDYTVIGDAVNVSARLCGKASGGQVLISASTAAALGPEFLLEPLEPMSLKGKSEPQPVFAVALR